MIRKSIMNMSIEKVIEILDSGKAPETEQDFGDFDTAMETAINLLKTHPDNQLNDPLTLEELREMDGEPVWVDRPGYGKNWALVNVWAKSTNIIYLTCNNGMVLHPQPELDSGAKIYRRRPEGG